METSKPLPRCSEMPTSAAAEAATIAEKCGSPSACSFVHLVLAEIAAPADPHLADDHLRQALALAEPVGRRLVMALSRVTLATLYSRHHDALTALRHYEGVIREWQETGTWTSQWVTLRTLVDLLSRVGARHDAPVLYGAVTSARTGAPAHGADVGCCGRRASGCGTGSGMPPSSAASRRAGRWMLMKSSLSLWPPFRRPPASSRTGTQRFISW